MRRLLLSAAFSAAAGMAGAADVAAVDDEIGQALLVTNRGHCYAVLPSHVAMRDRIALASAVPATSGSGEVFLRNEEIDLALAFVEGDLSGRCSVSWESLSADLGPTLNAAETGFVKGVQFGGEYFDRIRVAIIDADDLHVTVSVVEGGADAEILQGTSGSVLTVDGRIAGIAVTADDTATARFLRTDAIVRLLGPYLAGEGALHPDRAEIGGGADGTTGFRVTGFGGGRAGVTGLESGALAEPWVTAWTGEPIEFELTLSNAAPVPVDRLVFATDMNAGAFTPPQRVTLSFDVGTPEAPYFRPVAAPDMSPLGRLEVVTGGTSARRIKVRIESVWFPDRPLRLDSLVVD